MIEFVIEKRITIQEVKKSLVKKNQIKKSENLMWGKTSNVRSQITSDGKQHKPSER